LVNTRITGWSFTIKTVNPSRMKDEFKPNSSLVKLEFATSTSYKGKMFYGSKTSDIQNSTFLRFCCLPIHRSLYSIQTILFNPPYFYHRKILTSSKSVYLVRVVLLIMKDDPDYSTPFAAYFDVSQEPAMNI
jgi:hypothetical protein